MEKQILYHGSNVIVEHPLVSIGRKDLDFGPGFYLTPLFEQASKWAVRIKTIRRAKQAIVNTYEFALPQDSKVKRFDAYDKEWLDFIVDSRKGKQPWPAAAIPQIILSSLTTVLCVRIPAMLTAKNAPVSKKQRSNCSIHSQI